MQGKGKVSIIVIFMYVCFSCIYVCMYFYYKKEYVIHGVRCESEMREVRGEMCIDGGGGSER